MVKHANRLVGVDLGAARRAVEETVEFAMREMGDEEWVAGMHPEIPETKVLDNPYTYTEWYAGSAQWKR